MNRPYEDLRHRMTSKLQFIKILNIFFGVDIDTAS